MLPIRLVVVKFRAGARGDFVAGWLGKLPGFIESHWSFNPITGQTVSTNQHSLSLDSDTDLNNFLQSHSYVLHPEATIFYAGGVKTISSCYDTILTPNIAQILTINSNNINPNLLKWERTIKVFGRCTVDHDPQCFIDTMIKKTNISNQDRIDCLHNMLLHQSRTNTLDQIDEPMLGLDYNKLFQPGGSYVITNKLGIKVDTRYHEYWDYMLPLSETPKLLTLWGHQFCFNDYFTD